MTEDSFSTRLEALRVERGLSGRAFAKVAGLKASTYQALTTGRSPTLDTLVLVANSLGVNVAWLATGEGERYSPATMEQKTSPETLSNGDNNESSSADEVRRFILDFELFGRVVDRIASVYREEKVRISDIDLGRLAAERYAEVSDLVTDNDEWPHFLEVIASRVRKALRAAAIDPANVKREA